MGQKAFLTKIGVFNASPPNEPIFQLLGPTQHAAQQQLVQKSRPMHIPASSCQEYIQEYISFAFFSAIFRA